MWSVRARVMAAAACASLLLAPLAQADGLGYSYLDASGLYARPDTGTTGHGGRLSLSYALSDNAFMYGGASQSDFDNYKSRRYDFGIGINTAASRGYSLFATLGWNHIGIDNVGAPGGNDHGFGATAGIRGRLNDRWEMYALAGIAHNDALAERADGEFGALYALSKTASLGAAVNRHAKQNDYLLTLRWYY